MEGCCFYILDEQKQSAVLCSPSFGGGWGGGPPSPTTPKEGSSEAQSITYNDTLGSQERGLLGRLKQMEGCCFYILDEQKQSAVLCSPSFGGGWGGGPPSPTTPKEGSSEAQSITYNDTLGSQERGLLGRLKQMEGCCFYILDEQKQSDVLYSPSFGGGWGEVSLPQLFIFRLSFS